jgi:hypothetical protein
MKTTSHTKKRKISHVGSIKRSNSERKMTTTKKRSSAKRRMTAKRSVIEISSSVNNHMSVDTTPSSQPEQEQKEKYVDSIVYDTEESYRPIVIIPLRSDKLWCTENIGFYKSSAVSNKEKRHADKFIHTWFPIAGVTETSEENTKKESREKGHLIKMSDLYDFETTPLGWFVPLMQDYFLSKHQFDLCDALKKLNTQNIGKDDNEYDEIKKRYEPVDELTALITRYFLYPWQLKISAIIGGGYWEKNPEFRDYIKQRKLPEDETIQYDAIKIYPQLLATTTGKTLKETFTVAGEDEVIGFMNGAHAQSTIKHAASFFNEHRAQVAEEKGFCKYRYVMGYPVRLGIWENTKKALERYTKKP